MQRAPKLISLREKKCLPCEGGVPALKSDQVEAMTGALEGWEYRDGAIEKTYRFKDFHGTMEFVNAIAWIAHREDHHPDLEVGYDTCRVRYVTHSIGGLSENDFICAAKVDSLLDL